MANCNWGSRYSKYMSVLGVGKRGRHSEVLQLDLKAALRRLMARQTLRYEFKLRHYRASTAATGQRGITIG